MARRGPDTLRFGPMKAAGLTDPRTGRWPHAVVQLCHEDMPGALFKLVGGARDALALLPRGLPDAFSTADVAAAGKLPRRLAQQMMYCLTPSGVTVRVGKQGNAQLYQLA